MSGDAPRQDHVAVRVDEVLLDERFVLPATATISSSPWCNATGSQAGTVRLLLKPTLATG